MKGMIDMLNTQTVANTILMLSFEENIKITPMKLQKLLYFLYKGYLKETGFSLFTEKFEKWQYGPVLPSIYYEFNSFGASFITKFARDAKGNVEVIDMSRNSPLTLIVRKTWDFYKTYSAVSLSRLTHQEDTAWSKARYQLEDEDIKNERELR